MISMMQFFSRIFAAAALALASIASGDALAQGAMSGVPNAMQGFSQNRDQPIQIEAASLEMRDKKKEATFSGNVKVVQGDTTMTSKSLVVFYDSGPAPAAPAPAPAAPKGAKSGTMQSATPGPGGSSSIRRLEARGSVVVTQKDQVVTGETAIFDPRANLITMVGGRAHPVQERAQGRPPQGRHDDRRVPRRIRQRQGAGHVHTGRELRVRLGWLEAGSRRRTVADPR